MERYNLYPKKNTRKNTPNTAIFKAPPQDEQLERIILGTCLIEKDAFEIVNEKIATEDIFYLEKHQHIFAAMRALLIARKPIDYLTLQQMLNEKGQLETVGGPYYITTLTDDVVSSAHLQEHCLILLQKHINRNIIINCQEALARAHNDGDCFDIAGDLIKSIEEITHKSMANTGISFKEGIFNFIKDFSIENPEELTGVPSGFHRLDQCTNGWQPADLIILAARPSVGKTALALNMALNAATHKTNPCPVGFFSLEMSAEQLIKRMASTITEVDAEVIRKKRVNEEKRDAIVAKLTKVSGLPIYIDDQAAINWLELRAKAKQMKRDFGIKLFIIDYLQLMSDVPDGGERTRNREQVISRISGQIKKLAKDLKVPIIALSQLSRELERRSETHKIPVLSDLRDSGSIEQDADVVLFIYRPEYHGIETNEHGQSTRGETHIKIAKHRNGTLETVRLVAHLNIQKFEDATNFPTEERLSESGSKGFAMWQPISE